MTLYDKLKKFFNSNEEVEKRNLENIDNDSWKNMRMNNSGALVICLTMNTLISQMKRQFPEWEGLFDEVTVDGGGNVLVKCLKGFEDSNTRKAIPCLWRRKSFIENCVLVGVEKIIFLDPIANTFDMLEVNKVDASKLP